MQKQGKQVDKADTHTSSTPGAGAETRGARVTRRPGNWESRENGDRQTHACACEIMMMATAMMMMLLTIMS